MEHKDKLQFVSLMKELLANASGLSRDASVNCGTRTPLSDFHMVLIVRRLQRTNEVLAEAMTLIDPDGTKQAIARKHEQQILHGEQTDTR